MKRTARFIFATTVALAVVVPTFGGVASAAPTPAPTTAGTTTTDTTITVRVGDSLVGLSHRYQIRLSALLRANSLELSSTIHPGGTLVIPAGATLPTSGGSTRTLSAPTTPSTAASTSDYVVEAGDALAGIAWRHGVSLGALVKANGISVTDLILPGQRLQVPPATRPIPTSQPSAASNSSSSRVAVSSQPAPTAAPIAAAPIETAPAGSLQALLSYATAQVGAPYRFFSAGPDTFDCSGLVVAAFRQIGVSVPHQSRALARMGSSVDWKMESIAAGDLVFTSSVNDPELITHVAIALDSRRWVNAVGPGKTLTIGSIPSDDRIMAVQRIALP